MAGLIETSQKQAYFKLFIYSLHSKKLKLEWQKQMLCHFKKNPIFFVCFASLLTEVSLLPISLLQEYFPFL